MGELSPQDSNVLVIDVHTNLPHDISACLILISQVNLSNNNQKYFIDPLLGTPSLLSTVSIIMSYIYIVKKYYIFSKYIFVKNSWCGKVYI